MRNRYEKDEITQYFEEDNMRYISVDDERDIIRQYRREVARECLVEAVLWFVLLAIVIAGGAWAWKTHMENERQIRVEYR